MFNTEMATSSGFDSEANFVETWFDIPTAGLRRSHPDDYSYEDTIFDQVETIYISASPQLQFEDNSNGTTCVIVSVKYDHHDCLELIMNLVKSMTIVPPSSDYA